ncbi:MAG: proteasome assembly chaperone family protein [Haloarculaceae archaeon]
MARVHQHVADLSLDAPVLIEGLPGVGLVGKIATDHLIDSFDMRHVASCVADGLPDVAVYHADSPDVLAPVRIYADESRDLLALQSDVPVSPDDAGGFAAALTDWLGARDAFPLYLSGLPAELDDRPDCFGIACGDAAPVLEEHGIDRPGHGGLVSGPTGALLSEAARREFDALGLVVEANRQFPDPEAARVLLVDAVEPVAGIDVDTDVLTEQADEIAAARQELAASLGQGDQDASQAQPLGMFH